MLNQTWFEEANSINHSKLSDDAKPMLTLAFPSGNVLSRTGICQSDDGNNWLFGL